MSLQTLILHAEPDQLYIYFSNYLRARDVRRCVRHLREKYIRHLRESGECIQLYNNAQIIVVYAPSFVFRERYRGFKFDGAMIDVDHKFSEQSSREICEMLISNGLYRSQFNIQTPFCGLI